MTGLLQQYAVENLQTAYQRAFTNEKQLKDSNWELAQMQATLEQTIAERTRQLETRNKYLEASAKISRETTSLLDIDTMLSRVVLSISQEFNFYHVGIFLVDENNEWAELKAASSPGGLQMIARGHRLRVGKQGIVGYVTGIGQQRITQSTELDLIHSVTPELPETKAEMGLPLKARGEIIGALDIQHNEANPFNEDNISVLQTLADQIALALSNARLYQQAQVSIEETRRAYGEYNREAWLESQRIGALPSYRFSRDRMGVPERTDPREKILLEGRNKIAIPIQVRGLTIGSIDIVKSNDDDEWTEEQQTLLQNLSDQLAIALDSARLFNETQKRAATERLVGEVSTDIRETLDIDTILKTASEKVRNTFNLPEVSIRLAGQSTPASGNGSPSQDDKGAPENSMRPQ
jgi:GAF domain-containing protein